MQFYMALSVFTIEKKLLCGGKKIEMIRSGEIRDNTTILHEVRRYIKGPTTFESKFHN